MALIDWDATFETTPTGASSPAAGDDRIRELKENLRVRLAHEHAWAVGAPGYTVQGLHRMGSAIAYYQASAPTTRPDGTTALTTADAGRLFIDSDTNSIQVWTGSAMVDVRVGDQDLKTDDDVTFNDITATGDVDVTGAVTAATIDTGQGATEVYAMDQDVETTDNVVFNSTKAPRLITGVLRGDLTGDQIFTALSPFIPDDGDRMFIYAQRTDADFRAEFFVAHRESSTRVALQGGLNIRSTSPVGSAFFATLSDTTGVDCDSGSGTDTLVDELAW